MTLLFQLCDDFTRKDFRFRCPTTPMMIDTIMSHPGTFSEQEVVASPLHYARLLPLTPREKRSAFLKQPLAVEEHILGGAREPPGDRQPYESRLYSVFAGILQVEIRQQVCWVCMLIPIFCEGSMQQFLSRDTQQNRRLKKHRVLPPRGHCL
jgi:hypothetical protein